MIGGERTKVFVENASPRSHASHPEMVCVHANCPRVSCCFGALSFARMYSHFEITLSRIGLIFIANPINIRVSLCVASLATVSSRRHMAPLFA